MITMAQNLIIYYSRKGENYVNGNIEDLSKGNTEICAEYIQKAVGGDLFEIQTVSEYGQTYRDCVEKARKEICRMWMSMTISLYADHAGVELIRWQCLHSLRSLISRAGK